MLEFSRADIQDVVVLSVQGTLDTQTAPEIRREIDAIVAEKQLKVVFDLSNLNLIDSSGVGAIVSLFKRVRTLGGDVKICGLRGQPKEIFRLLRLERAFDILESREEAAARFARP